MSSLQEQLAKLQNSANETDTSADDNSTLGTVRTILAKVTGADTESIGPDSLLREELGVSSLDVVEIAVRVEQACGKKVDHESGFEQFRTVNDIVAFIDN